LSDRNHSVEMEISPDNFGDHRLLLEGYSESNMYNEKIRENRNIVSNTLDDLLGKNNIHIGKNTLVWIDTQGHEGHVLAGGRATFSNGKSPYVVVEMWPYGIERSGGRDLFFEFLDGCAAIYDINSENWAKHPFLSAKVFSSLYDQMLASSAAHEIHTDLLCIRRNR